MTKNIQDIKPRTDRLELHQALIDHNMAHGEYKMPQDAFKMHTKHIKFVYKFINKNMANVLIDVGIAHEQYRRIKAVLAMKPHLPGDSFMEYERGVNDTLQQVKETLRGEI